MSAEQDLANANVKIAELINEVQRYRDAAMGLNNIWPTITEGRNNTADGKYFSVPGNGAYMRLYRRQGSSSSLIAEFPDRAELNSVIAQLGPLLGRGVLTGDQYAQAGSAGTSLPTVDGAVYASRASGGRYLPLTTSQLDTNVDEAPDGHCALYSSSLAGTWPDGLPASAFCWVETQKIFGTASSFQKAYLYTNSSNPNTVAANSRQWYRLASNSTNAEGKKIWGPWIEQFGRRNIVGSVSQSGGIPTGAILEYGENANGRYLKLADGTLFCWHVINLGSAAALGSGTSTDPYRSSQSSWTYPHTFNASPEVLLSTRCNTGVSAARALSLAYTANNTTIVAGIQAFRFTANNDATDTFGVLFAIGRWY